MGRGPKINLQHWKSSMYRNPGDQYRWLPGDQYRFAASTTEQKIRNKLASLCKRAMLSVTIIHTYSRHCSWFFSYFNLKLCTGICTLFFSSFFHQENSNTAYRIVDSAVSEDKLAIIQESFNAGVVVEMVPWHLALDAGKIHGFVDDLVVVGHLQKAECFDCMHSMNTVHDAIRVCANCACRHEGGLGVGSELDVKARTKYR